MLCDCSPLVFVIVYLLEFDAKSRLRYGPGIDDALALILALQSSEVRVLGITTVAGNPPAEMTNVDARRVLEYLDAGSIPVAMGTAKPL